MTTIDLTQASIRLEPERGLSLFDAAGVQLTCLKGVLWLTMAGDPRDFILEPGDTHAIRRNGATLVNALEPSLVRVDVPRDGAPAWKRWLAGIWNYLASIGEARAHARMKRGLHYLQV